MKILQVLKKTFLQIQKILTREVVVNVERNLEERKSVMTVSWPVNTVENHTPITKHGAAGVY